MTTPRANSYIGIVTENFREAAAFYVEHFGYKTNADSAGFVCVQSPNGKRVLGFSAPAPEIGLGQVFQGGIHLPFLVDDADAAYAEFQRAGVPITREITIEEWGERHFVITDPAGIELYISEALKEAAV